ncbi:MAG TPA: class I SAM-dependent methyltransferase [Anaerolineales bacterium]|nr:class I SAM-dependent methyltransferase [Anaerolineales bacterium]
MDKVSVQLGDVQKTLFLPLWGRAVETKKEKPLLQDQTALEIIEKVDYDFAGITKNITEISQVAWIMRSIYIDEVIRDFLERHPKAAIVNIGCGMDTTFDRIDNGSLLWYDLDLPDVIELRRKFIQESERRKFIPASFLDEGWLKEIKIVDGIMFIAAGVFYYFEENEVKTFLKRLADVFPECEVFFDVSSPRGVRIANKRVITSSGLDERSYLKWGLKDTHDILLWDNRFEILKIYYYFKHKELALKIRMIGSISDWMKIQYIIHLRIKKRD